MVEHQPSKLPPHDVTPSNPSFSSTTPATPGDSHGNCPGDPAPSSAPLAPDLADVVTAWPDLPSALRAGIVAMVKAANTKA